MLAYYAKRSQGEEFEKLSTPVETGMWINGTQLEAPEINELIRTYNLAANIVYDVKDRQELPRVEFANNDTYLFIRLPRLANSGRISTVPLLCIIRDTLFLSLSSDDGISPEQLVKATLPSTTENTADLLLSVIASSISMYEELLKHTERSINDTGNRLRTHEVTNQDFIHFVTVEDNLNTYRVNLNGIATTATRLKESNHYIVSDNSNEMLDDILLHIQQLLTAVASYGSRVESIRNAYSTIADNNLNLRIKTLTVFTMLIALPNVFYGMYGMNVPLPFQQEPWMYGLIVGFTIIVTVVVYIVAKRLKIF